ncbi:MAG: TIGR03943 family protein [Actinobacteria bacterium]|nr:TIGR03943 family protein [Actinomycetota bacterium]
MRETVPASAPNGKPEAEPTAWSPSRLAGGLVLAAWAFLFWFLFFTGRVNLYLSTRTSWVVPVGAVLLTLAAAGRLIAARVRRPEPVRRREAAVMALMVLPVVVVLALPTATLGSFSASKKTTFTSAAFSSVYGQITATSEITLLSVAAAQTTSNGAQALAKRAGSEVDFVGFVTRYADTPAGEFLLTRYVITCCVADATVVQVLVVNVVPGRFQTNDWVEVKGPIYPIGREVILNAGSADSIVKIPRPAKPYLTP